MFDESNEPEEIPESTSLVTVAMPEFVTNFLYKWIDSPFSYTVIIGVTALIFSLGGLYEFEHFINSLISISENILLYALVLSIIFGLGIYVLMYGLSLATPRISTATVLAMIIANGFILIIIALIDSTELYFAHSYQTSVWIDYWARSDSPLMTNIWIVRIAQSGITALILSELNPFFRAPNEIRLNISLTIIMFIGLIGLSFGYVELLETSNLYYG